ncbi:EAL domain-containing protein [Rhodococcus sp. BP-252]|uniref:putative bifunctional diguanylate cyclase/phosphodiesterase n=1 Tax=unclassified Rhodococcus (in: high G+C Gram-positive bacteria) TaxID=192944 RepID=UPI001C9BB342|nr:MULTISPECIES: bifunctional diguanylate cyclase/phosphodiesterase [unclassified Rhodococcus (in: high G+C Gram-positive bacteria)]MBY6413200.1 EAL domain-containing protein [Rhodococcus sp. BP-320]MBY6418679.1 EAL domain-containing protein [Rhodococcus sp. BP-321]MBY6422973.1 EAL domain-containing protein [Rhodococcus sp. BP-324]MBY6427943.1 EAL domain-containing protein [Rhodococcus sp. BP-323]MBY6433121.1 EAL domain-containing protein [Rhodococcus sp. BP-322]
MRWWWYPALGTSACVGYFVLPAGSVSASIYLVVAVSSVIATIIGIRVNRPTSVRAWSSIAAGIGLWALGDATYYWTSETTGTVPVPSAADPVYLVGYAFLAAGLFCLVHTGWRRGELSHVANSSIVMIAFGLLMWVFVVDYDAVDVSTAAGIVGVVYPAMSVFLLGLLVHFIGGIQWRSASFRLLTAALLATMLADIASSVASVASSRNASAWAEAGYLAFYVLAGAAALHPSMRTLVPYARTAGSSTRLAASFNAPAVAVLTLAALVPPVAMALLLYRGTPIVEWGWGIVLCASLLVCLVFVRVIDLLRLLHQQTQSLRSVAETDTLTGLLNRRGLQVWMDTPRHTTKRLALLLLDIDRFQEINDTFGPEISDEVLCVVADRLVSAVGSRGAIGRVGADEFALAVRADEREAMAIAESMNRSLRESVAVRHTTLLVEASVGVAFAHDDPSSGDAGSDGLIQRARFAVHSAKTVQPRIARYDTSMDRDNSTQLLLLSDLTAALDAGHLELYYQPQVDLQTMVTTGVEALLRWNDPDRGVMEPHLFLPMAERTGLIRPLAEFVLTEALSQRQQWSRSGLDVTVSINLSTRNLLDAELIDQVRRALSVTDSRGENLTIEITETVAMADPPVAIEAMHGLRELGVTLAIDDYGTGYSSLAYLQRLPVQQLKIDKTFVRDIDSTLAHRVIVQSTIDLARTLGLSVTAEGVENRETLLELRSMQCTTAQGYHLGHPVPGNEIPARVAALHGELKELATRP